MTTENIFNPVSFEAGEDLSGQQYRHVKLNTSGQVVMPEAITDVCIGVLQNKPESGQEARVALVGAGGITKIVLGGTLSTPGDVIATEYVGAADRGKAQIAASTQYPTGILVETGVEDDIGSMILTSVTVKA